MLTTNVIRSASDAKQYFREGLVRQDYYSKEHGQEVVGQWHGKGAALLGLRGAVQEKDYFALVDNRHPTLGTTLTVRQKDKRRIGMDFTFSAPKGVSLLDAFGSAEEKERIREAVRASVRETMQEMEQAMRTRVRTDGRNDDRITGNMVWCDFLHTVARPVGGVPDPDLHVHTVVQNVTFDVKEQRWKAAEMLDLKRHAGHYDAVFLSKLVARMQDMGYTIRRSGKWWDIDLPRELIEKFSRRTAQIEAKATELGVSGVAKGDLGAKTREKKARNLDEAALRQEWDNRLSDHERNALEDRLSGTPPDSGGQAGALSPEDAIEHAVSHAFERASVIGEKELLELAIRRGFGSVTPEQVKDAAARANLLTRTIDGRTLVTTREVLAEEQAMLAFARDGRGTCRPLNREAKTFHSEHLNRDQIDAVRDLCTTSNRVSLVRGGAGTGKTTMIKDAAALIEAGGHKTFFFAPTADASRGELRKAGFREADTVARLLVDEVLQERMRGQVMWIDEAGLLSTRQLAEVFRLAERLGTRVILSGDHRQHGATQRGDAMRLLQERAGIRPVEVREIVRQKGAYKDAVAAIEKGDIKKGFDKLEALGWVKEVPDEFRHAVLVKDYLAERDANRSALVIAPTNREKDAVSGLIRSALQKRGVIGTEERPFWNLRNLYWTEAERGDAANYRQGLVVEFLQNAKGITRGERFRVEAVDAAGVRVASPDGRVLMLPLKQAKRFQVYEPGRLNIAAGDTIRVTQNYRNPADNYRLDNGTLCRVKAITPKGELVLMNGRTLGQDFVHVAHGYVTTSYAAQGKTVDTVLIAQGAESFRATSREQFYVSVSRGKKRAVLYTDDKAELKDRIQKSGERASASELLDGEVTAAIKLRRSEEAMRLAKERYRRYRAHMAKVMAASMLHRVKDQEEEQTVLHERSNDGTGMER